jgi:hypothetical protein
VAARGRGGYAAALFSGTGAAALGTRGEAMIKARRLVAPACRERGEAEEQERTPRRAWGRTRGAGRRRGSTIRDVRAVGYMPTVCAMLLAMGENAMGNAMPAIPVCRMIFRLPIRHRSARRGRDGRGRRSGGAGRQGGRANVTEQNGPCATVERVKPGCRADSFVWGSG